MKIAFIGQKGMPTKTGGVDRHVENLAIFLAKKGQEVIVYNRNGYLPEKISQWQGVKLVYLPFVDQKNLAAITHGFLATIDALRKKVDVIHYHGIGPCLLAWIPKVIRPKTKVIATLHSFDYGNDKWGTFAKFMLKTGEKMMCKYCDQVIVLTDLMRDYLLQRHRRDSIVIPNGAYVEHVAGNSHLLPFGLEEKNYIVSISRLIRLKGIQYLIEAFKALPESNLKLAIIGEGEYQKELEEIAGNDARIVFTGNQTGEALNQMFSQAKLFVQSSEMEGLSISLLEAMAHGLPCLVSDISANREASGDTAAYFKPRDAKDLQEKLSKILNDENKLQELAAAAKKRAEDKFDWNKISADTLKVYNQ